MYSTIFVCTTPTVRPQSPSSLALRAAIGSQLLKIEDRVRVRVRVRIRVRVRGVF